MIKIADERTVTRFSQISNRAIFWVILAMLIAFLLYLSTVQLHINGSNHAYATDVGEIQNALPRWGTIHHSSYPLYSALGSLFTTTLMSLGIPPAAGTSLFSAVFGAITVGLTVLLALEIGISGLSSAIGALVVAFSTSIWIDASLAEVHTVTLAFSVATLLFAHRFGRYGTRTDLLLLTFFFTQAVAHQRSVILLVPSVLLLIWPYLRLIWQNLPAIFLVAVLAPLTYIYLPIRAWMGAEWIFGAPGTWDGFWILFFDNRAGRVFEIQNSLSTWLVQIRTTFELLAADLPWPILLIGFISLIGMAIDKTRRRAGIAFILIWVLNFLLTVLIWVDDVSDAQLAAKLPILIMTGLGLSYTLDWLLQRSTRLGTLAVLIILTTSIYGAWQARSFTLTITRDRSVESIIETVDRVEPFSDGRRTTITTPWGRDFWGLTYAQAFRGQLQGLNLVDHNANHKEILSQGDHLLAPLATFLVFPVQWWENSLGHPLYLSTIAPEIIEMNTNPLYQAENVPLDINHDLENGIRIRSIVVKQTNAEEILLTVFWEEIGPIAEDYSIAVHLVAQDPPISEEDILTQADKNHPVEGYYPTTRWRAGEIVRDDYLIRIPPLSIPVAIRIGMYRFDPDQGFINSPWLSIRPGENP
ncbi:MAG: DUF2723 domain-containing protein [Candidatus Promineifilaceae bacterium]|nr:DUF2723 domain-containing protein [Candidatus Promineifilaceae bacterium]